VQSHRGCQFTSKRRYDLFEIVARAAGLRDISVGFVPPW
jgi:hypothetical protein